ncbi:MAG: sigma-70 family RNA polymerase sigma factor [Planctomycetes bacterium]|nr:sigma-70 family RNA polymerase sigma factor [Planctomycetota bacterium]
MSVTEKQIVSVLLSDRAAILARIDMVVGDFHRAEDVLQELSVRALDHRDSIENEVHLRRWLRTTGRNIAIDLLRHDAARPAVLNSEVLDLLEAPLDRLDALEAGETQGAIRRCIDELSPYHRQLIEHRYRMNLSGEALAAAMGRSANTIKVALTRAHRALLECFRRRISGEVRS